MFIFMLAKFLPLTMSLKNLEIVLRKIIQLNYGSEQLFPVKIQTRNTNISLSVVKLEDEIIDRNRNSDQAGE